MGMYIGKCYFDGDEPSKCFSFGTVTIYHNGTVNKTASRGDVNIWEGSGDVWVILGRPQDVGKNEFKVSGRVQIQHSF